MMDKIRTIPTTPAVASQAASKAKAAPATSKGPAKATKDETPAAEFAAAMLAIGQPQAVQVPKAPVMGADGKTLEAKSSADTTGSVASPVAGNMPGVAANAVSPEMMQARAQGSAGMNAGAMVAGLQPRNPSSQFTTNGASRAAIEGTRSMKEWVFDGVEGNPNLRSLFNAQAGTQTGQSGAMKGGEDLLNKIQSEQQVRGEMALDMDKAVSNQPMTSSQENSMLQGSVMSLPHQGLGHVSIERSQQPQVVNANGSSALSGAEYLSTLSQISMSKGGKPSSGMMSQGESGAGSFGREGGKAGLRAGAQLGEAKKTKLAIGGDSGLDAFAQNGAAATGVSGSAMLSGTGTHVTGKSAEGQTSMQAQVTTGSMAQDRIASASLAGMSSNIRNITSQGGGEIRVKLHPENLGELHLRIVTDGKQVGIQVQASDDKAKKILEESLSDLKDSLSKHQLSLGSVEFAVGQAQGTFSSDLGNDSRQNQNHPSFSGNMQDMMNSNGNPSNNHWSGAQDGSAARESWNGSPLRTAMPGGRMAARAGASQVGMSSAGGVASRRLDIRA